MKIVSILLTALAALGMMLAFLPLLGWLNWMIIPFTGIAIFISLASGEKGIAGVATGIALIGTLRLLLGGGIF